jgi:transposase
MLNDRQWLRIADLLPGRCKPTDKGGRAADNRRFVEAVLFIARTGCPWRARLKQFRRIATRYDKLSGRFNAFLHLACAYIWLL